MSKVFVVDTNKQPLNPVHPGWARMLLSQGKAAVLRRYPFTIILKLAIESPVVEPLRVKVDPGSKTTGLAVINDATGDVVFAAELSHRGQDIVDRLKSRASLRRGGRSRKTRYREPRWRWRSASRREGLKAPSMLSRVSNTETWVKRLMRYCPISSISLELVKFDMQQMENPDISGIEYQQGTLAGYEIQEYLLEKWDRKCAYCDKPFSEDVMFTVDHIHPRSKGGSNRPSNLVACCKKCNQKKNNADIKDFLATKPELLKKILAHVKAPLKDAAAVNSTRWYLFEHLKNLGVPIECGSGGRTKWNRTKQDLPKHHWTDAACVGESTPDTVITQGVKPLSIKAMGSGTRQRCRTDKYGFTPREKDGTPLKNKQGLPAEHKRRRKKSFGFQTGDIVKVTGGKNAGNVGRMTINDFDTGSFYFAGKSRRSFSYRNCRAVQRCDGYDYSIG